MSILCSYDLPSELIIDGELCACEISSVVIGNECTEVIISTEKQGRLYERWLNNIILQLSFTIKGYIYTGDFMVTSINGPEVVFESSSAVLLVKVKESK